MERPVAVCPFPDLEWERSLKLHLSGGFDPPSPRDKDKMREILILLFILM